MESSSGRLGIFYTSPDDDRCLVLDSMVYRKIGGSDSTTSC